MPRISTFYGIVITMYYNDHVPPHFHARYAEYKAEYTIVNSALLAGRLPVRAEALILDWLAIHRDQIQTNWNVMRAGQAPSLIDPLP